MSRPVRIEFPDANYYVSSRAGPGEQIFPGTEDRALFLSIVDMVVQRYGWKLFAYVLMDDHYHLVLRTPSANLSRGMRQLNGVYTQHYNRQYAATGPLFRGRFKAVLFDPPAYLLPLVRHVALNPLRLGHSVAADKYRWSSYRATAGLSRLPAMLAADEVLERFGGAEADSRDRFREFVKAGVGGPSPLDDRRHQVLLGGQEFVDGMLPHLTDQRRAKIPAKRVGRRRSLDALFRGVDVRPRSVRNELIRQAHLEHSYTLMEIGDHLGLHYTTVSKIING